MKRKKIFFNKADYAYMDSLSIDGWLWEFCRRNKEYKEAYGEIDEIYKMGVCLHDDNGVPALKRMWDIERGFKINPFYQHTEYGAGIPDPSLRYDQLPKKILPLFGPKKRTAKVIALSEKDIYKKLNEYWHEMGRENIESLISSAGLKIFMETLLNRLLFREKDVFYIKVPLSLKRGDILREAKNIIASGIETKNKKGDTQIRAKDWKNYLMVYDLREGGLPFSDIAKLIFPEKSESYDRGYPVTKEMMRFHKKAENLINKVADLV